MSLLYMYRAITMYVTVLPLSNRNYPCSPKSNETSPLMIVKRVAKLMSGMGLSVNGQHVYCGDFIYSGHTVVLTFTYLLIAECKYKNFYILFLIKTKYIIYMSIWLKIETFYNVSNNRLFIYGNIFKYKSLFITLYCCLCVWKGKEPHITLSSKGITQRLWSTTTKHFNKIYQSDMTENSTWTEIKAIQ